MNSFMKTLAMGLAVAGLGLTAANAADASLYERLGGKGAISAVVDGLVAALDKFNVNEADNNALLGLLGPTGSSECGLAAASGSGSSRFRAITYGSGRLFSPRIFASALVSD